MFALLAVVGGICLLIGWVWLIICGFSESVLWGVVIILFSPLGVLFGILNWPEYKTPTLLYVAGFVLSILARVAG